MKSYLYLELFMLKILQWKFIWLNGMEIYRKSFNNHIGLTLKLLPVVTPVNWFPSKTLSTELEKSTLYPSYLVKKKRKTNNLNFKKITLFNSYKFNTQNQIINIEHAYILIESFNLYKLKINLYTNLIVQLMNSIILRKFKMYMQDALTYS